MVSKIIGYTLAGIGVVVLALGTVPGLRTPLTFIPAVIKDTYIIGAGLILAVIGIFMTVKSGGSSNKVKEVPIFQGKEVVGFRRIGK